MRALRAGSAAARTPPRAAIACRAYLRPIRTPAAALQPLSRRRSSSSRLPVARRDAHIPTTPASNSSSDGLDLGEEEDVPASSAVQSALSLAGAVGVSAKGFRHFAPSRIRKTHQPPLWGSNFTQFFERSFVSFTLLLLARLALSLAHRRRSPPPNAANNTPPPTKQKLAAAVLWQRFGGGSAAAAIVPPLMLPAMASVTSSSAGGGDDAAARPAWRRRAGAALMQPVRAMVRCFFVVVLIVVF